MCVANKIVCELTVFNGNQNDKTETEREGLDDNYRNLFIIVLCNTFTSQIKGFVYATYLM